MSTNADDSITPTIEQIRDGWIGLTKKEYFAAIAMQGLISNPVITESYTYKEIINDSCSISEAMIEQLNAAVKKL